MVLAALVLTGCGVRTRDELVGEYVLSGASGAQTWVLRDDGSCDVRVAGASQAESCEWMYEERLVQRRVLVTLHPDPSLHGGVKQTIRYVLTPSHWPGQPITLPLSDARILRKVR